MQNKKSPPYQITLSTNHLIYIYTVLTSHGVIPFYSKVITAVQTANHEFSLRFLLAIRWYCLFDGDFFHSVFALGLFLTFLIFFYLNCRSLFILYGNLSLRHPFLTWHGAKRH